MKKLNKKGFTLVELLAVIVILALLMVVATRTIGSVLDTSKQKAAETEAQKIVSKTYEDIQTYVANNSLITNFTYKGDGGSDIAIAGASNVTFVDATYNITLNISSNAITSVCVHNTQQNNVSYGASVSNGNQIGTVTEYKNNTCATS